MPATRLILILLVVMAAAALTIWLGSALTGGSSGWLAGAGVIALIAAVALRLVSRRP